MGALQGLRAVTYGVDEERDKTKKKLRPKSRKSAKGKKVVRPLFERKVVHFNSSLLPLFLGEEKG